MTDMVLQARDLSEILLKLISTEKVRVREVGGEIHLAPVIEVFAEDKINSWDEFYQVASKMNDEEKPKFEDFPRMSMGRELVDFEGVQ